MGKSKEKQLELPLPRVRASERKAWIEHRLAGYEYRQRAREKRRELAYERRRKREAGLLAEAPQPQQLTFPPVAAAKREGEPPRQLLLPMRPPW